MTLAKIVSGGQTGVDRAVLDAALAYNITCGGWCPQGRMAEDGAIASHYPLVELEGGDYQQRTLKNVEDSDGTLIIYFDYLEGGTQQTLHNCLQAQKPYKLIDASQIAPTQTAKLISQFIDDYQLQILNVAGPRASKSPVAYDYTYRCFECFFASYPKVL